MLLAVQATRTVGEDVSLGSGSVWAIPPRGQAVITCNQLWTVAAVESMDLNAIRVHAVANSDFVEYPKTTVALVVNLSLETAGETTIKPLTVNTILQVVETHLGR
jgi:hypothetical protein